jgi:predicted transcriptional regulator
MPDQLPRGVSDGELQYRIHVRQKIERGLQDVAEGLIISQEEAERRMARWLREGIQPVPAPPSRGLR